MADWVYLFGDVDAIKEFVFETSSLPQVRGGSGLLQDCEAEIGSRYRNGVVYCAGGTFLLRVPAVSAEIVKADIERLYREKTLSATVTIVWEEGSLVEPGPAGQLLDRWAGRLQRAAAGHDGSFGLRMAALAARMREAKTMPRSAPFFEAWPFGRRCQRCGKRMAVSREPVQDARWLCLVCQHRDRAGRGGRESIHGQDVRGRFNQRFWQRCGEEFSARQPEDLDSLVSGARRDYLALLYADGNDIGRLLQRARDEGQYRDISAALTEATVEALCDALKETCGAALRYQQCWPFDIVNVGGDDVTVLVQAGYAWDLAVHFLKGFEEKINGRLSDVLGGPLPGKVTASCGIAIADARYPLRYLERLATSVLKTAKDLAKTWLTSSSALSFLWLPTPVAVDTAEPLLSGYRLGNNGKSSVTLAARPYTLEQASRLSELVREVVRWPRGLRQRWAEALPAGVLPSTALIAYDIARQNPARQERLQRTIRGLADLVGRDGVGSPMEPPVWASIDTGGGQRALKTALFDALELAELYSTRPDAPAAGDGVRLGELVCLSRRQCLPRVS
jgi:hypothetical protein